MTNIRIFTACYIIIAWIIAGSAIAQESSFTDPFSSQTHENDPSLPSEVNCTNLSEVIQSQREYNELYRSLMHVSLNRTIGALSNEQITPQQIESITNDIYITLEQMESTDSKLIELADKIKAAVSDCVPSENKE